MADEYVDHYATLGLHEKCTGDEIRKAYRLLAKTHHPDVNPGDPDAAGRIHAINEAYRVLGDPEVRGAYDEERRSRGGASGRISRTAITDIKEDVFLNLREFITGTDREISIQDPANPGGPERYELTVPEGTAPGTRFRIRRDPPFDRGQVIARVKPWPDARFKVKGSDLQCDLPVHGSLAASGGIAVVTGILGDRLDVEIPAHCPRGEIVAIEDEGLPRVRGGRGRLLVRIMYRPGVRTRKNPDASRSSFRRRLG